ncbi:MAG: transrane rhomboid family protein, partial [Bacteroidetes bacterium]|nr:transrane rhomboid family protein [Bacteroidota bacterium]
WQILTHMFMHADFMHILFNMYGLYIFGSILERVWGPKRFVEFYFMTGLGAMLLFTGVQAFQVFNLTGSVAPNNLLVEPYSKAFYVINGSMLGASGAIFGILTAFAMLFPNTELYLMFIPVPIKAKYLVGGYVIIELFSGIRNNPQDNVAHFAHLGGALIGFIIVKLWNRNRNSLY